MCAFLGRSALVAVSSCVEDTGADSGAGCVTSRVQRSRWRRHRRPHRLVRSKGEAFNSEKQTQQAVATMCFAGVADEDVVDESKKKCPWWKKGTCRWGTRCKWLHEGPAGIANVAKQHRPRGKTWVYSTPVSYLSLWYISGTSQYHLMVRSSGPQC